VEGAKELLDEGVTIRPEEHRLESQSLPLHPQERFEHRPAPDALVSLILDAETLNRLGSLYLPPKKF